MTAEQLDLAALLRDEGVASVDHDDWWHRTAMTAVRAAAATGREFQAFDLVEVYGTPEPTSPKQWGPLLYRAARAGLIRQAGYAPSRRPTAACSITRTWVGA